MTAGSDAWPEVQRLFYTALDKPAAERTAFLDTACGGDSALRHELDSLLAAHDSDTGALEAIAATDVRDHVAGLLALGPAGARIGSYRLEEVVAWGGMGVVYRAVHEATGQTVALKMLRIGPRSTDALRRFRFEVETLARLEHPTIARVLDAGVHDLPVSGAALPFFAMEFVRDAATIREFARAAALGTRDRIRLLCRVCEGVCYAHRMGVIHRDLKPGNVLVDGDGQPRIIDFGIARAIAPTRSARSDPTHTGQVLGTPSYMSPEQLDPRLGDVDTRTDVYALGVMLFELVTGRLPHEVAAGRPAAELAARIVAGASPPPRASTIAGDAPRDLDWVLDRALAFERERRYASVADFAADLHRLVAGEPVLAGPPSAAYRLRRLVRRHRAAVATAAAIVLALLGGLAAMAFGLQRARAEGARAERAAEEATAVRDFLTEMLAGSRIDQRGPDLQLRDLVDAAAARVVGRFAAQPLQRAAVQRSIGLAYHQLGFLDEARTHLRSALDLRQKLDAPFEDVHASMLELAAVLLDDSELADAEELLEATLAARAARHGEAAPTTLDACFALALLREAQGLFHDAAALLATVVAGRSDALGSEHAATLTAVHELGRALWRSGRHEAAERELRTAVDVLRRTKGELADETIAATEDLAGLLRDSERHADAVVAREQIVELWQRRLGRRHPNTLRARYRHGVALLAVRRTADALAVLAPLGAQLDRALGANDALTIECDVYVAIAAERSGERSRARTAARRALARARASLGPDHPVTVRAAEVAASLAK